MEPRAPGADADHGVRGMPPDVALVIALDRWGRILLIRDTAGHWELPGGAVDRGASPDAAALEWFETSVGEPLEELRLFTAFEPAEGGRVHVYYCDPDIELSATTEPRGVELRYFRPDELPHEPSLAILTQFVASTAYRAMFH